MEYSKGTANLKPFHSLGSFLSLCLFARTIACPLTFSTAGIVQGTLVEPAPSVIASGIGVSICDASYSPDNDLSRETAHPAVLITSTLRPHFL